MNLSRIKFIGFTLIVGTLFVRLLGSFIDPDMWWHILLGRDLLAGSTINTLTFTCTDYTWVNHSWLSDVLMYQINVVAGFKGLSIFFAFMFIFGILFSLLSLRLVLKSVNLNNTKLNTLLYLTILVLNLYAFIAARPQIFTFLFINILFYFLLRIYLSNKVNFKYLLLLIPFAILWVNLHGGFVLGLVLLGVFLLETLINILKLIFSNQKLINSIYLQRLKFLVIATTIFLIASLINPFGLDLWREIFTLVLGSNNAQYITEWRSVNIKEFFGLAYFAIFILALVFQILNKRFNLLRLLLVLVFGVLSFYSVRYILPCIPIILILLFVEVNIFAKSYIQSISADKDLKRLLKFLKVTLVIFVAIIALIGAYIGISFYSSLNKLSDEQMHVIYPVKALEFLKENRQTFNDLNFYNTYVWGGYLAYNLPEFNWFIDGRMPEWNCSGKAGKTIMSDYISLERIEKNWNDVLLNYNIKAIIIQTNSPLAQLLYKTNEWKVAYTDNSATIFLKQN